MRACTILTALRFSAALMRLHTSAFLGTVSRSFNRTDSKRPVAGSNNSTLPPPLAPLSHTTRWPPHQHRSFGAVSRVATPMHSNSLEYMFSMYLTGMVHVPMYSGQERSVGGRSLALLHSSHVLNVSTSTAVGPNRLRAVQ